MVLPWVAGKRPRWIIFEICDIIVDKFKIGDGK